MGWHEVMEAEAVRAAASPLDSARFGRSVERLTVSAESAAELSDVRAAILASDADIIVLRYPAEYVGWFAGLTTLGRTAIPADSLAYWRLRVGKGRAPDPAPGMWPGGTPAAAEVRRLVRDIFAAYGNHYLANPLFEAGAALDGYEEWALRSAAQGACVTVSDQAGVLALATLEEDAARTEILLAGVVPQARGRSIYAHLLRVVEDRAASRGAAEVVISTQGHNTRVQRAWARYGFEPVQTVLTVHLIRDRLLV
ncbi:GNAT family N-acetyltransferase [Microtetraspora niveoalba]|uniref:GNAT family N-acetyltransferase n=1 Tax=Microtetraspora niveoalba TaxID=46175 RepID=UPI00083113D5|nr:GNAT family N-acetyltransferase [Microtetraspora niveoalba]